MDRRFVMRAIIVMMVVGAGALLMKGPRRASSVAAKTVAVSPVPPSTPRVEQARSAPVVPVAPVENKDALEAALRKVKIDPKNQPRSALPTSEEQRQLAARVNQGMRTAVFEAMAKTGRSACKKGDCKRCAEMVTALGKLPETRDLRDSLTGRCGNDL